jgi:hypothetical protein
MMAQLSNSVPDRTYSAPTDASKLRALLMRAGLSQRGAALELGIAESTMWHYCLGDQPVPRAIFLALGRLLDMQRAVNGG